MMFCLCFVPLMHDDIFFLNAQITNVLWECCMTEEPLFTARFHPRPQLDLSSAIKDDFCDDVPFCL